MELSSSRMSLLSEALDALIIISEVLPLYAEDTILSSTKESILVSPAVCVDRFFTMFSVSPRGGLYVDGLFSACIYSSEDNLESRFSWGDVVGDVAMTEMPNPLDKDETFLL